jgi:proteasome accessory factor B
MLVSDQKTERLINLTLALLATKRFLTKNEIFSTVAGYSGSAETKERMFERDKDELRSLGIKIDVRGIDPLFEDEQGYLIKADAFQMDAKAYSQEELLYLTMAANLWHESALHDQSRAALLKIQSLSGPVETDAINLPIIKDSEDSTLLSLIFEAVNTLTQLKFEYKGTLRVVNPYGLYSRDGFWYLIAKEAEVVKTFKLVRFNRNVEKSGKPNSFEKPKNFDLKVFVSQSESSQNMPAEVLIRKNQALALRKKYITEEINADWDLMRLNYSNNDELIENLLWYASDVVVVSPQSVRDEILSRCREVFNG